MNESGTVRKLRAIMFSDIVGYSKMMQSNETEALKILQKHKDVVTEISAKYGGKIIKHIGDEILIESESAVTLVQCAKELQKYFADRNATVPKSRELWVRIGIHIGDVIIKDEDIFGDGVNIASRIRPIANPGGIVITHSVLILLGNQDDIKCNFIGNKKLKNIKEKIQVYEVLLDSQLPSHKTDDPFRFNRENILKVILPISLTLFFLFLLFFLMVFNNITDYEEDYFRSDLQSAHNITKDFKSIKNIKANYFNIKSAEQSDFQKLLNYYSDMYSKNRNNPKASFFLGLAYLNFGSDRNLLDSAYTLLKKSEKLGINSVYFHIAMLDLYKILGAKSPATDTARKLKDAYPDNPLALFKCAEIYKDICRDDLEAVNLYRDALEVFPEYADAYNALSDIEFGRYNYEKAKILSDSALAINPTAVTSVQNAVKVYASMSQFENARKILDALPDNSLQKYLENAKLSLLENEPAMALQCINDGQAEFPTKEELIQSYFAIQNIITLSDSIQQKESSVSGSKNQWVESWDEAVSKSSKEKKPLLIVALDNTSLNSKYLELALSQKEIIGMADETVMYRLFRHKDRQILEEFGISDFPAMILADENKRVIRSFINSKGSLTDKEVVHSFISESVLLGKRIFEMNRDSEDNRYKTAKNFSHAEELALEFGLPVIVVLTSKKYPASETYLKQTIFNPGFLKNYKKTILLSIEDADNSELAKKYNVNKFPTVLFFDEDINLLASKYGVMPQKVLADEIDKVKLYRKRKDIPKDEINWIYDPEEAMIYSKMDSKPILVYLSRGKDNVYIPDESVFSSYDIIRKINSLYIPLFIDGNRNNICKDNGIGTLPSVGVMNMFGDILYHSALSEDEFALSCFLDHNNNTDLLLSLGAGRFRKFLRQNDLNFSLLKKKLYASAGNELLLSVVKNPSYAYNLISFSSVLMNNNDFLTAEHYLELIKEKNFQVSDKFLEILVSSFMMYEDFDRLSNFLIFLTEKFKNDPAALSSLYSALSEINLAQSKTIDAIDYAEKANKLDPKRVENLTLLGLLNYGINNSASQKFFKSALILDPGNLPANLYLYKITNAPEYASISKQAFYSGDDDFFGLRYFDSNKNFPNPGILELRDRAYRLKLSLFPHETGFMHELVRFITDNKGDMSEALDISKLLLEKEPENPEFLSTTSWIYYNLGDFSEADKISTRALGNLSPDDYHNYPNLFYNIGMIKSAIGDNRSARYYFEKLLSFSNKDDFDYNKLDYAKRFIESIH